MLIKDIKYYSNLKSKKYFQFMLELSKNKSKVT